MRADVRADVRAGWLPASGVAAALLATGATVEALGRALYVSSSVADGGFLGGGRPVLLVAWLLLGLATTVPVGFGRAQPAAVAVAVTAGSVLSLAAFRTLTGAGAGAELLVLYRLGQTGPPRLAVALAAPFVALALVDSAGSASGPGATGTWTGILTVLLAASAPAAAWAGIAHRARGEALAHRAARQAVAGSLLEHTARGERARISRELHDVVAHHISMIAVEAETARLTVPGMPAAGAARLSSIGDTARAALTEMRRLLGVLREDAGPGTATRRPQPGLRQLNELLDAARDASGAGARLIVSGPLAALDPGVELAAYRIVQEALTNARRHAPGAAVDVELHYTGDELRLRVRDNGPGPPGAPPGGGHGLLGMRERAAAVGGELRTGSAAGGGFLVEARLPASTGSEAAA